MYVTDDGLLSIVSVSAVSVITAGLLAQCTADTGRCDDGAAASITLFLYTPLLSVVMGGPRGRSPQVGVSPTSAPPQVGVGKAIASAVVSQSRPWALLPVAVNPHQLSHRATTAGGT